MKRGILIATALATFAGSAVAGITFDGMGAYQSVKISFNGVNNDFDHDWVKAGKLKFKDPTNGTGLGTSFQTLCVDLDHTLSSSSFTVDLVNTYGLGGNMEMAGKIVRAFFAVAGTSNANSAALQVAVWEAAYDGTANAGTPDFAHGVFKAHTSSVLAQAATYYAAANNTWGNSLWLKPNPQTLHGQGQIVPVPEPGTVCALALGALGLMRKRGLGKRERARKQKL